MKHTVINNSNNNNTNPSGNAGTTSSSSSTIPINNNDPNSVTDSAGNPKMNTGNFTGNNNNMNSRRFPGFSHDFGFDGDDDDDDMFANMGGLRSRLNRMGHPFDWGNSASAAARKRRGSGGGSGGGGGGGVSTTGAGVHQEPSTYDPYDQYFQDDIDFPHHFGSPQWGDAFNRFGGSRKRSQFPTQPGQSPPTTGHGTQSTTQPSTTSSTQPPTTTVPTQQQQQSTTSGKLSPEPIDRSGFFDYLPPEFRKYIPASFGFPSMRHHVPSSGQPAAAAGASPPQQKQHRQPQWQQPQHPHSEPNTPNSPLASRAHRFTRDGDLSNQRPKYSDAAIQTEDLSNNNNNNSNNNNNNNNNVNINNNNFSNSDNISNNENNNLQQHGLRNTVDLGQKSHPHQEEEELRAQDRSQSAPPNEKIYVQTANIELKQPPNKAVVKSVNTGTCMTPQDSQTPDNQQQFNYPATATTKQQQEPSPQSPNDENFIRTVPIFVEGRNNNNNGQSQSRHPQPTVIKTTRQPVNEPMTMKSDAQQQQQQQQQHQQQQPPPTPHTAVCIDKIQNIQKDVLDLMGKVEKFNGARGDKEYMYLDEMLTRNLLKLDTIDTDGKDSIRLARKEAIKCVQASIAVLEAKADLNLKGAAEEAAALATGQNPDVPQKTDNNIIIIAAGGVSTGTDGTTTETEIATETADSLTDQKNTDDMNNNNNVIAENVLTEKATDEKSIAKTSDAGNLVVDEKVTNEVPTVNKNVDDVK